MAVGLRGAGGGDGELLVGWAARGARCGAGGVGSWVFTSTHGGGKTSVLGSVWVIWSLRTALLRQRWGRARAPRVSRGGQPPAGGSAWDKLLVMGATEWPLLCPCPGPGCGRPLALAFSPTRRAPRGLCRATSKRPDVTGCTRHIPLRSSITMQGKRLRGGSGTCGDGVEALPGWGAAAEGSRGVSLSGGSRGFGAMGLRRARPRLG